MIVVSKVKEFCTCYKNWSYWYNSEDKRITLYEIKRPTNSVRFKTSDVKGIVIESGQLVIGFKDYTYIDIVGYDPAIDIDIKSDNRANPIFK